MVMCFPTILDGLVNKPINTFEYISIDNLLFSGY